MIKELAVICKRKIDEQSNEKEQCNISCYVISLQRGQQRMLRLGEKDHAITMNYELLLADQSYM